MGPDNNVLRSDDLIYVAGHRGLVGSAVVRRLRTAGFRRILTRTHTELDLTDRRAVQSFFAGQRPGYVVLAAAKVGGIHANNTYPAELIHENLLIEANVIDSAYRAGVDRLLFLGSSCIYPKHAPQPIPEEALLTGPLEPTNEPYAVAKIAGIKLCESYNRQYGTHYRSLMPTNLYGPGDNFDPRNGHVIPALLGRFHDAKQAGDATVTVWGSGTPRREFLYIDDLAVGHGPERRRLRPGYPTHGVPSQCRLRQRRNHPRAGRSHPSGRWLSGRAALRQRQARRYAEEALGRGQAERAGMASKDRIKGGPAAYLRLVSGTRQYEGAPS
jgi:UDP-glucose 4-epimerase